MRCSIAGHAACVRLIVAACIIALTPFLLVRETTSAASKASLVPQGRPWIVAIPRIAVHASLETNALTRATDGHAPFKWEDAAWYSRGPRPGAVGNAFIWGHLDSTCCPAVFWRLSSLQPGDRINVYYPQGQPLTFRVMWSHTYWNAQVPNSWIFGPGKQRGLVLFTCAGVFHGQPVGYDHKLVVFARLVLPNGRLG